MSQVPEEEQRFSLPEEKPGYVHGYGPYPWLRSRAIVGGAFMGLASVVPGVSGGTMLLAAGIYPFFMEGIYDLTSLRLRTRSLFVVLTVVLCALLSVALLGPYMRAVATEYRWASYSLFAGLAVGGIPVVLGMAKPWSKRTVITAVAGLAFALGLTSLRAYMDIPIDEKVGAAWYFFGGLLAGGAMVLPGISGAYLMVLLGVFMPIMDALDVLREGWNDGQFETAFAATRGILLPAGIGAALGIFLLSRVFHRLLHADRKATIGTLIGLLVGALVELWPFQRIVEPHVGDVVGGRILTQELLNQLPSWRFPSEFYMPDAREIIGAVLFFAFGAAITALGARFGARNESGYDLAGRTNG